MWSPTLTVVISTSSPLASSNSSTNSASKACTSPSMTSSTPASSSSRPGIIQSDVVLDDVSYMLGCTRSSLNVVAAEKRVVVGRLIYSDNGDMIDCTKMGMGGKAIPPNIDRVGDMQSDALFILLVEKDAAYMRLAEDRFYNRFPSIIVTAKGQPDVSTRLVLRKMKIELKLPVLALVDSDPYWLKILSVYGCGSKNMSYDSASLTTPDKKWLGVRHSDLDKYKIHEQCILPMTE